MSSQKKNIGSNSTKSTAPSSTRPKLSVAVDSTETLAADYASRFDRLRQSPLMKTNKKGEEGSFSSSMMSKKSGSSSSPHSPPSAADASHHINTWDRPASPKMYPFSFAHAPLVGNPAFERCVRMESSARGGFFHYLSADYDLHRRCALPPQQARFEASFINVKLISLHDEKGIHSGGKPMEKRGEAQQTIGSGGRGGNTNNATAAPRKDIPNHHHKEALRDIESFYFHRGDDFYHLAADYDIHRRCGLPSEEARFRGSFLDMASWWSLCHTNDEKDRCEEERAYWGTVNKMLKELHDEYPHLGIKV